MRRRLRCNALHRYQSPLFELPLPIKVQKVGFQNREDGVLLEKGGSASVRYWYTRTYNVSARNIHRKLMLYFPSSLHIRCRLGYVSIPFVIKVHILNYPLSQSSFLDVVIAVAPAPKASLTCA